jgi:hypothetical protein
MDFGPPIDAPSPPTVAPPDSGAPAWWEDGEGGDAWGPFPRRRRSRVLRVVGVGVAAALMIGTVGTALEVVLAGRSTVSLSVIDVNVKALSSVAGAPSSEVTGTTESVRVTFTVLNHGSGKVVPVCRITMVRQGKVLGTYAVVGIPSLAGHASRRIPSVAPVGGPVPGGRLASADVACQT